MRLSPNTAAVPMLVALFACDPCGATFGCEQAPRVAVAGQILDQRSGAPVVGAEIEMQRVSGVAFVDASARTTTRSNGTFEIEMLTRSVGDAVVTLRVASPGQPPYQVLAVRTRATIQAGEATVLRPWVSANPTLPYVIELYYDGTADQRIVNSVVEFRRTGGVRLFSAGAEIQTTSAVTNDIGWVFPFRDMTTDGAGDLIGDLIIRLPAPLDSAVIPNLAFPGLAVFGPQLGLVRLGVTPD